VLAGAVFWASETPDESAAPPNNPAVPLNKIRRDRDCRRTVVSVIAVPPNRLFWGIPEPCFSTDDRGCTRMKLYSLILSTSSWVKRSLVRS
jgi:hypothetical protein